MTYRADLERAMENALPRPRQASADHSLLKYADAPDSEPITLSKDYDNLAHRAYASTEPGQLDELVSEFGRMGYDITGMRPNVAHEQAHWNAAQHLGATVGRFGIHFGRDEIAGTPHTYYRLFLQVPGLTMTKLGMAVMKAFPEDPSDGDEADYKALGYTDIDHIAERVRLANRREVLGTGRGDTLYPVPLAAIRNSRARSPARGMFIRASILRR